MANPVLRGFAAIGQFSGRDGPSQFWPYAGVAFGLVLVLSMITMLVVMQSFFAETQSFAAKYPEAATVTQSPTSYSIVIDASHPEAPDMDLVPSLLVLGATVTVTVILLAAAVSRRLHDCNRSAFFGLGPLIFLVIGLILFPLAIRDFTGSAEPNFGLFGLLLVNNMLYLISLLALVIQCAQRGTLGSNRFGDAPVRTP